MYTVDILESCDSKRHYIGQTNNMSLRLSRYNNGEVRSTKAYAPWKILYTEEYDTRSGAVSREKALKRMKGGIQFKKVIQGCG